MAGEQGNDTVRGGPGNNTLNGGSGINILAGGLGADIYEYFPGGNDTIFESSSIDINTIIFFNNLLLANITFGFGGNDLDIFIAGNGQNSIPG